VLRPILGHAFEESPATEILQAPAAQPATTERETDRVRAIVEEKLGAAPVEVDELIRQCGAPAAEVLTALLELELAGRTQRQPGNRVAWR
jgi:DNA processing protein